MSRRGWSAIEIAPGGRTAAKSAAADSEHVSRRRCTSAAGYLDKCMIADARAQLAEAPAICQQPRIRQYQPSGFAVAEGVGVGAGFGVGVGVGRGTGVAVGRGVAVAPGFGVGIFPGCGVDGAECLDPLGVDMPMTWLDAVPRSPRPTTQLPKPVSSSIGWHSTSNVPRATSFPLSSTNWLAENVSPRDVLAYT